MVSLAVLCGSKRPSERYFDKITLEEPSTAGESPWSNLRARDFPVEPPPPEEDETSLPRPPTVVEALASSTTEPAQTSPTPLNATEVSAIEVVTQSYENAKDAITSFFVVSAQNLGVTIEFLYHKVREMVGWDTPDDGIQTNSTTVVNISSTTMEPPIAAGDTIPERTVVELEHSSRFEVESLASAESEDGVHRASHILETIEQLHTLIERIRIRTNRRSYTFENA
ncbi:unnamed protein product [Nippostrongylus brasiliensis]|uniref:Envelope-like protein n=1 Tax=Nippostrongylus brasiliensis TaxID=27835 RepID=A0A158QY05_NIPBR|nr:unnamed protein product [Nippostrongylus brasiliensis]